MRTFYAGNGRVHQLVYSPDGKHLVVDLRDTPTDHPWMGFQFFPARELTWWDWVTGQPVRRFWLRDSLYGPGGACRAEAEEEHREDWQRDGSAFDVSFCFDPWRIVTAWEWSNKEDGNCVYDADGAQCLYLETPYKTHTMRLAIAPNGGAIAALTVNNMDGSALVERWSTTRAVPPDEVLDGVDQWRRERIRAERANAVELVVVPSAFAFDGRFVAIADAEHPRVEFWDTEAPLDPLRAAQAQDDPEFDYRPIRQADVLEPEFKPAALAFGAEHRLAVGGTGLAVWNSPQREWARFPDADDPITALAFDARTERLVAGTASGNLELWHVASGNRVRVLACGVGPVTAVAFSSDGLTCAGGGLAGQVVVWDVDA